MVMRIIKRSKGYDFRVLGAIEIRISFTLFAFGFTVSMTINIDLFMWLITAAKFASKTSMPNVPILVAD